MAMGKNSKKLQKSKLHYQSVTPYKRKLRYLELLFPKDIGPYYKSKLELK